MLVYSIFSFFYKFFLPSQKEFLFLSYIYFYHLPILSVWTSLKFCRVVKKLICNQLKITVILKLLQIFSYKLKPYEIWVKRWHFYRIENIAVKERGQNIMKIQVMSWLSKNGYKTNLLNSVPNDKILDKSKLKQIADNILKCI